MSTSIYSERDLNHASDEILAVAGGSLPPSVSEVVTTIDCTKSVTEGVRPTNIGIKEVVYTNSAVASTV